MDEGKIYVAHRVGQWRENMKFARKVVVRLKYQLKERIFENIKNLKDKTNSDGKKYYINKQLPEYMVAKNRVIKEQIAIQKSKDRALPVKQRSEIKVKDKVVFIDGDPVSPALPPVQIEEMFPEEHEMEKQNKIKLTAADPITVQNSSFMAYACRASQLIEVKRAYRRIRRLHPGADHIVAAYSIKSHRGYQDDGEHSAGYKLLRYMEGETDQDEEGEEEQAEDDGFQQQKGRKEKKKTANTAVFVVRLFGGVHLGPDRFKHIRNAGLEALKKL